MKQLDNFIQEKLRLDKNIKISDKEIELRCNYKETCFSKEEFEEIIEQAKQLPIIPDYISKSKFTSYFLNLVYVPKNIPEDEITERKLNIIRIKRDPYRKNGFSIRILRTDKEGTVMLESAYSSVKTCFRRINKYWQENDLSSLIKKYD